jgi:hypothetical protein
MYEVNITFIGKLTFLVQQGNSKSFLLKNVNTEVQAKTKNCEQAKSSNGQIGSIPGIKQ